MHLKQIVVGQTKSVADIPGREFEALLWEKTMYGILEGVLETGIWRI
jgi:hypothetical protein